MGGDLIMMILVVWLLLFLFFVAFRICCCIWSLVWCVSPVPFIFLSLLLTVSTVGWPGIPNRGGKHDLKGVDGRPSDCSSQCEEDRALAESEEKLRKGGTQSRWKLLH